MKSWIVGGLVVVVLLVMAGWLLVNSPAETGEDRIVVAATIFPLADIVQNVAGAEVKVVQVIPADASPHSFRLQPKQVAELQRADIVFGIGHGLDDQITEAVIGVTGAKVVNVDTGIKVSDNPHYWLSVPNAQQIAGNIARELSYLENALQSNKYEENLARYLAELDQLEAELQVQAAGAARKDFISLHDAWEYLADQYGFDLVATYEPEQGRDPSVSEIRDFGAIVKQLGLQKFYTEPGEGDSSAQQFLRSEFGLAIEVLDPIGGREGTGSYIELMRANIRALAAG